MEDKAIIVTVGEICHRVFLNGNTWEIHGFKGDDYLGCYSYAPISELPTIERVIELLKIRWGNRITEIEVM